MINFQFSIFNFQLLFYFLLLTSGLSLGSFLNVVIDRLPLGQNLWGRSVSDCCGRTLGVSDLLPVLSFILSRGQCRYCHQAVSLYYPMVELLTALTTVFVFYFFPFPYSLFYAVNFYFLIVFFFTDLKYGLVPVSIFTAGFAFVSFSYILMFLADLFNFDYLFLTYATALGAALFFAFLIMITRGRGMGFGDVLLAFLFSLMVGFPTSILMIFLSFIFGGLVSVILIILKKKHFGQSLPFGPFLSLASALSLILGKDFVAWYLQIALR